MSLPELVPASHDHCWRYVAAVIMDARNSRDRPGAHYTKRLDEMDARITVRWACYSGCATISGSPVGPTWKTMNLAPTSEPAVRATMGRSGTS